MKIGAILLAAGASSRLGEAKQLLKFQGKTLLRLAAEIALQTQCSPVVVVLGANAERCAGEIQGLPVEIAVCEDWREGMSRSIKTGLTKSLESEPNLSAIIILVCDQPFVTADTIGRLIEIHQKVKKPIAACQYADTIGVPALFARETFAELLNLKGDAGAKTILKKYQAEAAQTPAPEAAFDVDTEADLHKLLFG